MCTYPIGLIAAVAAYLSGLSCSPSSSEAWQLAVGKTHVALVKNEKMKSTFFKVKNVDFMFMARTTARHEFHDGLGIWRFRGTDCGRITATATVGKGAQSKAKQGRRTMCPLVNPKR